MTASNIKATAKSFLTDEELALIRQQTFENEKAGHLTEPLLNLIYEKEWLKIMIPKACGGKDWPLPRIVQLFETLAYADGNLGWCINLGAGANLFAGYLEQETAVQIFSNPKIWCAGSGAASGKAFREKGGYRVSGKWKYASGSLHATHLTANCFIYDESGLPISEDGNQVFRSFIFPAEEANILDTWHTTGLKATNSNDFESENIFVPDNHVFSLLSPSPFAESPLFKFPFDSLAVINMACMPTGIALHFLELFENLMASKKPLHSQKKLGKQEVVKTVFENCKNKLSQARIAMYKALEEAWEPYAKGGEASEKSLENLTIKARLAAKTAREILFELFPMCGMSILYTENPLNKVWRDLSVAGQHYLLAS